MLLTNKKETIKLSSLHKTATNGYLSVCMYFMVLTIFEHIGWSNAIFKWIKAVVASLYIYQISLRENKSIPPPKKKMHSYWLDIFVAVICEIFEYTHKKR